MQPFGGRWWSLQALATSRPWAPGGPPVAVSTRCRSRDDGAGETTGAHFRQHARGTSLMTETPAGNALAQCAGGHRVNQQRGLLEERQMRAVNASPRVLSAPAGRLQSTMEIRYLQPDGLVRSPAFSHGAVIPPGAATIYIGGQNGVDETGKVVASHDAAAQAVRAVDNVETVLRAAGATLADVVVWTVLIAADADVAAAYGAIALRLARAGAPPLVTAARVAGLAVPGALLEISAVAALTAD